MKTVLYCLLLLVSLNLSANDIFKRSISGNLNFTSIISDNDSTVIIAGQTMSAPTSGILLRINSDGDVLWSKKFNDSLNVVFTQLTFNFDSSMILVAGALTDTNNFSKGLLVKFDLEGNLIWQKSYHEDSTTWKFTSLSFVGPDKLTIAAEYDPLIRSPEYGTLLVADSSGNVYKSLPVEASGSYSAPIVMQDGSLFLTGVEYNNVDNECKNFGMNIDSSLTTIIWKVFYYEGNSEVFFTRVSAKNILLKNGNVIFSISNGTWHSCIRFKTLEIDPAGNVLWASRGGPGVMVLNNNSIYVEKTCFEYGFFSMYSSGTSYSNYDLILGDLANPGISSIGNQKILLTNDGFILMDSSSCNVINSGTQSDTSGWIFTTLPLASSPLQAFPLTFAAGNSNLIESPGPVFYTDCLPSTTTENFLADFSIFPNPASEELNIEINFLQSRNVAYSVSDLSGKIILSENINLSEGSSFSINTDNFSSGIYFVNLIIDERSINKKVFISN